MVLKPHSIQCDRKIINPAGHCSTLERYKNEEEGGEESLPRLQKPYACIQRLPASWTYFPQSFPTLEIQTHQSCPSLLNCLFDRGEKLRRPRRQFTITRHPLLSDMLDDVVLQSRDQFLTDGDRVLGGYVWIQKWITIRQELFDSRSLCGIAAQTPSKSPNQATRDRDASNPDVWKADDVVGIRYGHNFPILIRDVRKGRLAVSHLVQETCSWGYQYAAPGAH